jgi:hypothetical protein
VPSSLAMMTSVAMLMKIPVSTCLPSIQP